MAIEDTWYRSDGSPSAHHLQGRRWRVRYNGGPSKSFEDSTRKRGPSPKDAPPRAVENYWLKVRTEEPRPASEVTVGELLPRWLVTKRELSKSGQTNCRLAAARVRERWGDTRAVDVTKPAVREWLVSLDGSASKRRKTFQALSGSLRIALEEGAISINPCAGVEQPSERARAAKYLSVEQVTKLADAAGEDGPVVYFLATSGLRIGEAAALNVGDVDASRCLVRVRAEDVGASKTEEPRDVGLPRWVVDMLDLSRPELEPVFIGDKGARLNPHNWRKRKFYPAVAAAGLAGVRPHDLRHTAVSLAAKSGVREKVVQQMVGHKRPIMTGRYSHLFDSELVPAANQIGSLFRGNPRATGSEK